MLVGTPDDRVTSLVTPGRAVAFRASGNAELQMRVPFRARPDADVRADQAVRTVLFERALRDVHVWLAIGDDEWTLPAEYLADAAEA